MAILAECPICHRKQKTKNKFCPGCGNDLDKSKKAKKVRYWIAYRLPNGKQRREPVSNSIEKARDADGKRRGQKRENRIFDILPDSDKTFNQLAEWYLDLEKVKALAYYKTLCNDLSRFNEIFGDTIANELRAADLESYQVRRQKKKYAKKSIDDHISAARNMVTKSLDNDFIGGADLLKPFRKTKKLLRKGDNRRQRYLEYHEYQKIYDGLPKHSKPIFAMGFWTGMRAGEILKLRWDKTDLRNRMIYLSPEDTKERRAKKIPISKTLRTVLMQIPGRQNYDLVFTYAGKPIKDIRDGLKRACKTADIVYGRFEESGFIFHDLRRTFITNARKAGVSRNVVMSITGHSNARDMNIRYDQIDDSDLLNAIDQLEVFFQNVDHSVDQMQNRDFK
jgi:integrase